MFVDGVMLDPPVGPALGQVLRQDAIQRRFQLRVTQEPQQDLPPVIESQIMEAAEGSVPSKV